MMITPQKREKVREVRKKRGREKERGREGDSYKQERGREQIIISVNFHSYRTPDLAMKGGIFNITTPYNTSQ